MPALRSGSSSMCRTAATAAARAPSPMPAQPSSSARSTASWRRGRSAVGTGPAPPWTTSAGAARAWLQAGWKARRSMARRRSGTNSTLRPTVARSGARRSPNRRSGLDRLIADRLSTARSTRFSLDTCHSPSRVFEVLDAIALDARCTEYQRNLAPRTQTPCREFAGTPSTAKPPISWGCSWKVFRRGAARTAAAPARRQDRCRQTSRTEPAGDACR